MPAFDLFLALGDVILAKKRKNSPFFEELTEAVYSYLIDKCLSTPQK